MARASNPRWLLELLHQLPGAREAEEEEEEEEAEEVEAGETEEEDAVLLCLSYIKIKKRIFPLVFLLLP